jgi:GT2 family glycosyltransferase
MSASPRISIVIPTHNRCGELLNCLSALERQDFPAEDFEVLVVADGCTDATVETIGRARFPFQLKLISQNQSGASAARNRGAEQAKSDLLLFVDDDVIASTGLVAAHVRCHSDGSAKVVVGPYLPEEPPATEYEKRQMFGFWHNLFQEMGAAGHRPSYKDVVSGNLSIASETFQRVGGFDEGFKNCGMEDYELGVRLLSSDVELLYAPTAFAKHLYTTDLRRSLIRKWHEGAATLTLVNRHPATFASTRLASNDLLLKLLILAWPEGRETRLGIAVTLLDHLERHRRYRLWRFLRGRALEMAFWDGACAEVGGRRRQFAKLIGCAWRRKLRLNVTSPL